ncbi:CidA/LrgA family holin-like protein [Brevibacillus ginsengisoli]|uniref:CidA/LrgA family holin-like protein n=1 Tax=Brevibacillus ginsengisoli TaxID=363854 RepID=UPI003CE8EF2F
MKAHDVHFLYEEELQVIRLAKVIGQVSIFVIIAYVMNKFVEVTHLHIPGSILGFILMFLLLQLKLIRLEWVELGANLLLAELLLFFIPSAAGIIQYTNILYDSGVRILLVVILSMVTVMAFTGLFAQALARRRERKTS